MRARRRRRGVWRWAGTVVCALLVGVWVGSGWWSAGHGQKRMVVYLASGVVDVVVIERAHDSASDFRGSDLGWHFHARRWSAPEWVWGFMHATSVLKPGSAAVMRLVRVPLWSLIVLAAVPTAWMWWRHFRTRPRAGRCGECGYDLAGLAEGAACPECGRAVMEISR